MNTCKTCKHWNRANEYETGHAQGLGRCDATAMLWESTEWREDMEGRVFKPEAEAATAFVQDGSDYSATLYTKENHGCTMHLTDGACTT